MKQKLARHLDSSWSMGSCEGSRDVDLEQMKQPNHQSPLEMILESVEYRYIQLIYQYIIDSQLSYILL